MYKIRHYCSHISPNTPRSFLTRLKTRHKCIKYKFPKSGICAYLYKTRQKCILIIRLMRGPYTTDDRIKTTNTKRN